MFTGCSRVALTCMVDQVSSDSQVYVDMDQQAIMAKTWLIDWPGATPSNNVLQ